MADVQSQLPLSFPAILRNPSLSDRFAHLHLASQDHPSRPQPSPSSKKEHREFKGKRRLRRRDNAKFTHNPHVAAPTSRDFAHPLQLPSSTFPHPLPSCLPRSLPAPSARPPPALRSTSSAGLFSLSLRGVRRVLRAHPCSPLLVQAVESHLAAWLQGGTYLNPDQAKGVLHFPGVPVGGRQDVREVGREAGRLVWAVKADPNDGGFERYVVHCVARWHGIVSFSKETDGHRLTYLLRPNTTRANAASRTLDTPPATDASDFHVSDASPLDNSDLDSASDVDSATDDPPERAGTRSSLSDIAESRPSSPDSRSILDASDGATDSEDDRGFAASMESLSLSPMEVEPADVQVEDQASRARADRVRRFHSRSASSPSPVDRSPRRFAAARGPGARRRRARNSNEAFGADKVSFYEYLFV